MAYNQFEPLSKQITIVIGLTVVGCMAFGLALSFYRNLLFEQTLETMRTQNMRLKENVERGYGDLEYFKSSQYRDKYAKENLGLVTPGENVLIIAMEPEQTTITGIEPTAPTEQQEAKYFELLRQMPVLEHWNLYLFHREKIDEIKMGL